MFYEYANRKAFEIVNLRRDLFGEIVEIVSDETVGDRYFAADSESADELGSSDLEISLTDEETSEIDEYEDEMEVDLEP